ncbi:MAG: ABC transporter substrate-binding protein [Saprospiraceae bacterium]|nr:MAG: ABC transporter substrate-binding protein [Saprospiraceae bacterium]
MLRLLLSIFVLFLVLETPSAQNVLPIGSWRAHLPYHSGEYVSQGPDKVYFATELSIMELDKEERSQRFISQIDGLSNTGIKLIKYNAISDVLVVVYNNSVIDLVKPTEVITMPQIKNFTNISGEKTVNDIFVENDSMILLAGSYGISRVNIRGNEFAFSTFTGTPVNAVIRFDGDIYAGTDEGIYRTSATSFALEDFSSWEYLDSLEGFPNDYSSHAMAIFNNQLYLDLDHDLYRMGPDTVVLVQPETDYTLEYLTAEGAHLLVGYRCNSSNCGNGKMLYFDAEENMGRATNGCFGVPRYAVEDDKGRVWFADQWRFFRMINNLEEQVCTYLDFNSPYSEKAWSLNIENNQLWIAGGGLNQAQANRFLNDGFYSFIDGNWTNYNRDNTPQLKGEDPNDSNDDVRDFLSVQVNPVNGKVYVGSFLEGLVEVDGETMTVFNEHNSSLENAEGDGGRVRIGGIAVDEDGNVWMTNHSAENGHPFSVLKTDGTWQSFNKSCGQTSLFDLDIDDSGFKWAIVGVNQAGVVVFDSGNLDDSSDDRCEVFTASNSNLTTNETHCLVADLDGEVWVGTGEGIIIFECGSNIFDSSCPRGSRRIVEGEDGNFGFLLETEVVQALAVDGANRKWVGTKNGVYLLSPNGEKQILRFTVDNSPLFDNNILDIAVNQLTGEVFFSTDKGVLSYQSDAILGGRVHNSEVEVFPNPVRPEYDGPIAIRGLARDANVKITDISGKLVYETQALGGQAIWDGRDYNGQRAYSGVYLVFSSGSARFSGFDKTTTAVARILVIN